MYNLDVSRRWDMVHGIKHHLNIKDIHGTRLNHRPAKSSQAGRNLDQKRLQSLGHRMATDDWFDAEPSASTAGAP